jgi:hypothetical protein
MLPSIKSNFYLTTETTDPSAIFDYVGGPIVTPNTLGVIEEKVGLGRLISCKDQV